MTDVLNLAAPATHDDDLGAIGDRELVAIQTIDIGRLRSAPVPITAGHLVAVTGRGARGDSNGSGKTTFLGAVTLLLGDVGWRPAAGCPEAATLLFDATKAGVDVERHARADEGFIIGVFVRPCGQDPMTVWMRIRPNAPYIKIRHGDGVRLVSAGTPTDLRSQAAETWQQLGKPEWGSKEYAARLYGPAPRCMAWLQTRGNETPGKSLLRLSQEQLEPVDIGTALLELLGRQDLLQADLEARRDLDTRIREVNQLSEDDARRRIEEDHDLASISARAKARDEIAAAQEQWALHYAQGALEAAQRVRAAIHEVRRLGGERRAARGDLRSALELRDDLGDGSQLAGELKAAEIADSDADDEVLGAGIAADRARRAVTEAENQIDELKPLVAAADGTSVDDAESALDLAKGNLIEVLAEHQRLRAEAERLTTEAAAIAAGDGSGSAGRLTALLRANDAGASALLDLVRVHDNARPFWEPLLHLFADAVVIDRSTLDHARRVAEPGAILILRSDPGPVPEGLEAPPELSAFLQDLSASADTAEGGVEVINGHAIVLGGFGAPTTGRAARADAAGRRATEAQTAAEEHTPSVEYARTQLAEAEATKTAADAVARTRLLHGELEGLRGELNATGVRATAAAARKRETQPRLAEAIRAKSNFDKDLLLIEREHDAATTAYTSATLGMRRAIETVAAQRDWVRYWTTRWGGDSGSAQAAIEASPGTGPERTAQAWAQAANRSLERALRACGIDSDTGEGAPPGTGITMDVEERTNLVTATGEDRQLFERQAAAFTNVVDAVDSWLERTRTVDETRAQFIDEDRARRSEALASATSLCDDRRRDLPVLQDGIERTIRSLLDTVSTRLDALDRSARGSGADLVIDPVRPQTPTDTWEWRVTPRYRRSANGPPVPYTSRANTATEKLLAINLVLAALFASAHGNTTAGRVLVLDELGDSLGDFHREAVLRALAETAQASRLTVLGTCQDGVLDDAALHAGQILYFQFRHEEDILNAPTRVYGRGDDGVVALLADHVERLS